MPGLSLEYAPKCLENIISLKFYIKPKKMSTCKVHSVRFYDLEPRAIHCMAYEPQFSKLALSRGDNSVELWDLRQAPHIECSIPNLKDNSVECLAWCGPRLLSTGLQGLVVEYNLSSFTKKFWEPVTAGPAWCLAVNNQKDYLAVGTEEGYINLFFLGSGCLQYEKIMDKQEGRILCIAWSSTGEALVTGSLDTVRIWNVKTGHAIHRMTTGRSVKNKETIVWCLAVTDDFTIISGDSRGYLSFWNGTQGVLIDSHQTHAADILALCLKEEQDTVYCAGVDPVIGSFSRVEIRGPGHAPDQPRTRWVRTVQRRIHEHDVRTLVASGPRLMSGGIDGYLAISSYPPKALTKYPPLLKGRSAVVCADARCLLLQYPARLEVWQLGSADAVHRAKLLSLDSCNGDPITCAALSPNARWLAYSTPLATRLFHFTPDPEKPQLSRVPGLPEEVGPARHLLFSTNSSMAVAATCDGALAVLGLSSREPVLLHLLQPLLHGQLAEQVHLLEISDDGQILVAADHCSNIAAWMLSTGEVLCSLPCYKHPPTAMAVQPQTNILMVAYSDHKVVEYSLRHQRYTEFSTRLNTIYQKQWLTKGLAISGITFSPCNEDIVVLYDESTMHVINKHRELPRAEAKIPRLDSSHSDSVESSQAHPHAPKPQHGLHVIKKYKHLAHLGWLSPNELVAVEVSPLTLAESLPPMLQKKRFGM